MTVPFRLNQPVIVTPPPGQGAPYAARFAQASSRPDEVFVRGPQGLHPVALGTVTPRSLELGDDKALRHGVRT